MREMPEDVGALCTRKTGVGADGVIVLEPSDVADFRMRIYNADGSEAEMCGNGLRCFHRFAGGGRLRVETAAGVLTTWDEGELVACTMPPPTIHALQMATELGIVDWIDTGVPHAVLFVDDLDHTPVVTIGRELRHHPYFGPAGSNIDFVEQEGPRQLRIRTFERGVEDETLACGTGACAAAIALCEREGAGVVEVEVRSGETLTIRCLRDQVEMVGPAQHVFDGQLTSQMIASSAYG